MSTLNNERHELHRPAEAICDAELDAASGGMMDQLIQIMTNLANMRHNRPRLSRKTCVDKRAKSTKHFLDPGEPSRHGGDRRSRAPCGGRDLAVKRLK